MKKMELTILNIVLLHSLCQVCQDDFLLFEFKLSKHHFENGRKNDRCGGVCPFIFPKLCTKLHHYTSADSCAINDVIMLARTELF